jgi:Ca-activated chloride channel family protein
MPKEDFNNDAKMAGAIGAGHTVTALYEIVPAGKEDLSGVDPLKYQKPSKTSGASEMLTLKIRSKEPEGEKSVLSEYELQGQPKKFDYATEDCKFAAAVAAFGMVLRDSPYKGNASMQNALQWAKEGRGIDRHGYRDEFISLVNRAMNLSN